MRSLLRHPNYCKKITFLFLPSMKMSGKFVNFGDKNIKKSKFYKNKEAFKKYDIDVNLLVSKEECLLKWMDLLNALKRWWWW